MHPGVFRAQEPILQDSQRLRISEKLCLFEMMKSTIFLFSTDKQISGFFFRSELLLYTFLRIHNFLCLFGVPIALENSTIHNQRIVGHRGQVLLLSVTYNLKLLLHLVVFVHFLGTVLVF